MNATQWLFELESLHNKEETKYEEIKALANIIKHGVVSMLGLNLLPMEEQVGIDPAGDPIMRYRNPDISKDEFLPLVLFAGREDIIKEVLDRQQAMHEQDELEQMEGSGNIQHMTPEELDEFMRDEDDISFDDPSDLRKHNIWNSAGTKMALDSFVKIVDNSADVDPAKELASDDDKGYKGSKLNKKTKIFVDD